MKNIKYSKYFKHVVIQRLHSKPHIFRHNTGGWDYCGVGIPRDYNLKQFDLNFLALDFVRNKNAKI